MMCLSRSLVLELLAASLLLPFPVHARINENLLQEALQGLNKATRFFAEDYSSINVDGLFGIRIGQGSVNQSLEDCKNRRFRCPSDLQQELSDLYDRIEDLAVKAMPYIELQDSQYYQQFLDTFNAPYIVRYRIEFLGASVREPGHREAYDEEDGDKCYSQLFGTFVDSITQRKSAKCTISEACWKLMTKPDMNHYAVTHQLLYFVLGENIGCMDKMASLLKETHAGTSPAVTGAISVRDFERELCGHILAETLDETHSGIVKDRDQDMFAEQCLLCGILGFADFFSEDWLHLLLSWQRPNGCFSRLSPLDLLRQKAKHDETLLLSRMLDEVKNIEHSGPVTGRKLMREQIMTGGCLAHKTGLAYGLLATYVRFYVNALYGPTRLSRQFPATGVLGDQLS